MAFPSHTRGISGHIGPGWETEELRQRFRDEKERDRGVLPRSALGEA